MYPIALYNPGFLVLVLGTCIALTVIWIRSWLLYSHPSLAKPTSRPLLVPPLCKDPFSRPHPENISRSILKVKTDSLNPNSLAASPPATNQQLMFKQDANDLTVLRKDVDDIPEDFYKEAGRAVYRLKGLDRILTKIQDTIAMNNESGELSSQIMNLALGQAAERMLNARNNVATGLFSFVPLLIQPYGTKEKVFYCENKETLTDNPPAGMPCPYAPNLIPVFLFSYPNSMACILFDLRSNKFYTYGPPESSYSLDPQLLEQELRRLSEKPLLRLSDFSHIELSPSIPAHDRMKQDVLQFFSISLFYAFDADESYHIPTTNKRLVCHIKKILKKGSPLTDIDISILIQDPILEPLEPSKPLSGAQEPQDKFHDLMMGRWGNFRNCVSNPQATPISTTPTPKRVAFHSSVKK